MALVDDSVICLVCNSPTKSTHFGIEVCRACASFFKRNFESQRRLVCRQGDKNCDIVKNDPYMCRLCRFEKCLRLNMDVGLKIRNEEDKATKLSIDCIPSTSREIPILDRIALEYRLSFERRRKAEHEIRIQRHNLRRVKMNKDIYIASVDFVLEAMSVTISELAQFTKCAFPAYSKLPNEDQCVLMKAFLATFIGVESFEQSFRISPDLKYCMKTAISCIDRDKADEYVTEDITISGLRNSLFDMLEDYNDQYFSLMLPIFTKSNFTPIEYNALMTISMWELDKIPDMPENLLKLGEIITKDIIHDLNRYYTKELGLSEYSVRMGNLLTASHTMKEVVAVCQEQSRIVFMYLNENAKTAESIKHIKQFLPFD